MRGLLRLLVFTMLPTAMLAGPGLGQTISASSEADAVLARGEELQKAGDLRGAIEAFQDVASTYPESREACAWAAVRASECLKSQGDVSTAFDTLQTVLAHYPDVPSACALAQCKVGEEYVRRAQLERAELELRLVRDKYPRETETVYWADLALARCLTDQGREEEALEATDRILQAYPGDALAGQAAWASFMKASILQTQKKSEEAAAILADAAERYGEVDRWFLRQCLLKLGEAQADDKAADWQDAAATLRWFLAEFPEARRECAFAQYKLASLIREHGDASEAVVEYGKVWTDYPDQAEASMNAILDAADVYSQAARYEDARSLLEQGISAFDAKTAKVSEARLRLIECLWVQGEFDAVVPVAEALVSTGRPGLATARQAATAQYRLGRAHEAKRRPLQAANAYAALVETFGAEPALDDLADQACFRRGNALAAHGDVPAALQAYQQLIDRNPEDDAWRARGAFCRATTLVGEGLTDQARREFQALCDELPRSRFADLAEKELRDIEEGVGE